MGKRCLTRVELEMSLHEVECCVNSRPLTFSGDTIDSTVSLSPSHFVLGRRSELKCTVEEDFDNVTRHTLTEREHIRLDLMNRFWTIWRNEYLRSLPVCIKKFSKQGSLKVGSVVLLERIMFPEWDGT